LLIRYESAAAAGLARQEFVKSTVPQLDAQGLAETKDGKWQAVGTVEDLLVIVLAAPNRFEGLRLMSEVKKLTKEPGHDREKIGF